mgnify:CR=1 FL=1
MSGIAQAVGIKKASLYSHYSGKESIFKAVFDRILEDYRLFMGEISTCNDHSSSLAILRNIFSRYILNCRDNIKMVFWDRYYYYPPDYLKDYIHEQTYRIEMLLLDKITVTIEQGISNGEIKRKKAYDMALSFYNMMIGFAMGVKFYDGKEIREDIDRCINSLDTSDAYGVGHKDTSRDQCPPRLY